MEEILLFETFCRRLWNVQDYVGFYDPLQYQRFGMVDLFITMTCNPIWEEIKRELLLGKTWQDRPHLLTRVFRAKLEELKEDINGKWVLGNVVSYAYVIEFQKRGLPHVHMLVVLDKNDKFNIPYYYDRMVHVEFKT